MNGSSAMPDGSRVQLECPLCGAHTTLRFVLSTSPIRRCDARDCRLVYAERQPSTAQLEAYYTQLYYPKDAAESSIKCQSDALKLKQHLTAIFARIGRPSLRVLDVGCGLGNLLEVASGLGASEVAGVEQNDAARSRANARGFEVVASIEALAERHFDLIYMNDVIEHLREPWAYCRDLRALLSASGHLFAATGDVGGLKSRLLGKRWDIMQDPTHLFFFSRRSLTRAFVWAGYQRPQIMNFAVDFSHHGLLRRVVQRGLVASGLDSSLKIMAAK